MALFFTFGAFAVSLAHESAPVGPVYAVELHHLTTTGPAQLYARLLAAGWQFESGDVPEPIRPCWDVYRFRHIDLVESLTPFNSAQIQVAKVSLQILQSALLL
jgi:hypothetical protein